MDEILRSIRRVHERHVIDLKVTIRGTANLRAGCVAQVQNRSAYWVGPHSRDAHIAVNAGAAAGDPDSPLGSEVSADCARCNLGRAVATAF